MAVSHFGALNIKILRISVSESLAYGKAYHSISFYCDDIHKTVEGLKSRGVEFCSGISDESWGRLTHFQIPGNLEVELYQPKYEKRIPRKASKARTHSRRLSRKRKAG